jgi:hypothetical protein
MRILDEERDAPGSRIWLYLTPSEASELRDALTGLLAQPRDNHIHVSDDEAQKEISVAIYDERTIGDFFPRIQQLLREDS